MFTSSLFTISLMIVNDECHHKYTELYHNMHHPLWWDLYNHQNDCSNSRILFSIIRKSLISSNSYTYLILSILKDISIHYYHCMSLIDLNHLHYHHHPVQLGWNSAFLDMLFTFSVINIFIVLTGVSKTKYSKLSDSSPKI